MDIVLPNDINAPVDSDGSRILHVAARMGNVELVRIILNKRANVNQQDNDGYTPLYIAALNANVAIMRLLIERGANVQACTAHTLEGSLLTPLHIIASTGSSSSVDPGRLEGVKLLLQRGADPNVRSSRGETPIDIARFMQGEGTRGYNEILAALQNSSGTVLPRSVEERHGTASHQQTLEDATRFNNSGVDLYKKGTLTKALEQFQRSVKIRERLAPDSLDVAESYHNMGAVYQAQGKLAEASEQFQRSVAIKESLATKAQKRVVAAGGDSASPPIAREEIFHCGAGDVTASEQFLNGLMDQQVESLQLTDEGHQKLSSEVERILRLFPGLQRDLQNDGGSIFLIEQRILDYLFHQNAKELATKPQLIVPGQYTEEQLIEKWERQLLKHVVAHQLKKCSEGPLLELQMKQLAAQVMRLLYLQLPQETRDPQLIDTKKGEWCAEQLGKLQPPIDQWREYLGYQAVSQMEGHWRRQWYLEKKQREKCGKCCVVQ